MTLLKVDALLGVVRCAQRLTPAGKHEDGIIVGPHGSYQLRDALARLQQVGNPVPIRAFVALGGTDTLNRAASPGCTQALTGEDDMLQRVFRRVEQPSVEVAALRALRLLLSNVAGECAFSD